MINRPLSTAPTNTPILIAGPTQPVILGELDDDRNIVTTQSAIIGEPFTVWGPVPTVGEPIDQGAVVGALLFVSLRTETGLHADIEAHISANQWAAVNDIIDKGEPS